jgi:hypothetical protein
MSEEKESKNRYPTEWSLGKPRGSLKEEKTGFRVTMSPPKEKQYFKYFKFADSSTAAKQRAQKEASLWLKSESDKLGLTRNMVRYLSKDVIEVQLLNDITFKTDTANLKEVEKYPINMKTKKEKGKERHYVMSQDKKTSMTFTSLICDYKIVEYIDGNTLNLCSSNLKEFGSVKTVVKETKQVKPSIDQYKYFEMDVDFLPKNVWMLGKPAGTVFNRKNQEDIFTARVPDGNKKQHSKTFNAKNYSSREATKKAATKWQYNTSYKLGVTSNMIRIIDNDTIEVKLTKEFSMITDLILLPLVQSMPLFSTHCQIKTNTLVYCSAYINEKNIKFHKLITGFPMVDHMNHNSLDNRLINLRFVDHSENNRNKTTPTENIGVREVLENNGMIGYEARAKFFGQQISKIYYGHKYSSNDEAKKCAIEFRKNICDVDINTPDFTVPKGIKDKDLNLLYKRLDVMTDDIIKHRVKSVTTYLAEIDIDNKYRAKLFNHYDEIQLWRIDNLMTKQKHIEIAINSLKKTKSKDPIINPMNLFKYKPIDDIINLNCKLASDDIIEDKPIKKMPVKTKPVVFDLSKLSKIVKQRDGKILSSISDVEDDPMNIKILCHEKHEFIQSYHSLIVGKWCYYCNNSKLKLQARELCKKLFNVEFEKVRPSWLKNKEGSNLELDLYNKDLKLAFEICGEQHYEFIKMIHGTYEQFERQQQHDKLKRELCVKNGITLIEIPYYVTNLEEYVKGKIPKIQINRGLKQI